MTVTPNVANKRLILQFTDDEWSTLLFINKVYGSVAFRQYIEKLLNQRKEQRRELRRNKILVSFESANDETKQQILTALNLTFDDE
jgi:hypothetical protein